MQLPAGERARLADRLIQSLSLCPEALHGRWVQEADDRMEAYRAGDVEAVDGPQAMADLRARFKR